MVSVQLGKGFFPPQPEKIPLLRPLPCWGGPRGKSGLLTKQLLMICQDSSSFLFGEVDLGLFVECLEVRFSPFFMWKIGRHWAIPSGRDLGLVFVFPVFRGLVIGDFLFISWDGTVIA